MVSIIRTIGVSGLFSLVVVAVVMIEIFIRFAIMIVVVWCSFCGGVTEHGF